MTCQTVSGCSFDVTCDGRAVPAVLWRPSDIDRPPVLLLGHGGSGHKGNARNERIAKRANGFGIACVAIDGPFHGDRELPNYQERIVSEGARRVHERMRDEWLCALQQVASTGAVDADRVGFLGMSMGARYGIPTCAALGERLRCAVLGKFGLDAAPVMECMAANGLIRDSAKAIRAPLLLHAQWDDELFPRAGAFALFDLFGSSRKQLYARTGGHAARHTNDETVWCDFVFAHLVDSV